MEIGPVEYMVVAFPGNRFRGEIAPALSDLVADGIVRIIDLAFVGKDASGEVVALELTDLDPDVQEGLGNLGIEINGLLSEEDIAEVAAGLEPDSSAALLVWEDVWAARMAAAIRGAGGVVLELGRIPHETVQAAHDWAVANI